MVPTRPLNQYSKRVVRSTTVQRRTPVATKQNGWQVIGDGASLVFAIDSAGPVTQFNVVG